MISIAQLRAARGLLGWSKARLAEAADLPARSLRRYEAEDGIEIPEQDLDGIRRVLEAAGVEFLEGAQPGVRMKAAAGVVPIEELNASNDE
ncbi:MAG: transcriptional regulator [Methylovirgula sp.]